jgi:hypothetical protein
MQICREARKDQQKCGASSLAQGVSGEHPSFVDRALFLAVQISTVESIQL